MGMILQGPMRGWRFAGSAPQDFTCEVQAGAPRLCSKGDAPTGFATLMQTFAADDYCGRRVRWRATRRVRGVGGEGGGRGRASTGRWARCSRSTTARGVDERGPRAGLRARW